MRKPFPFKACAINLFGSAILAFGLYHVHSVSAVTEGGQLGLTLLLQHWFSVSPAISGLLINIACYGFGWKALAISTANGALNRVANFLLVVALVHLDASVQSPLVTGGVMIVSTFICILQGTKPSRKELLSVAVAFLGMLALFLIKI